MAVKKDIKEIKLSLKNLEATFNKNIKEKAEKYDELYNDIKKIKFDNISLIQGFDNYGNPTIKVNYNFSPIILRFDDNYQLIEDNVFKAINKLNMISLNDMEKLKIAIYSIESKKNGK